MPCDRGMSIAFARSFSFALIYALLPVGCLASPPEGETPEPVARIVAMWNPLACADPLRVVVELEAESGARYSRSAPCAVGTVTVDVDHWGFFFARAYSWVAGVPRREENDIASTLAIDAPIVYWQVSVPPL
jgi:hypothetical protein